MPGGAAETGAVAVVVEPRRPEVVERRQPVRPLVEQVPPPVRARLRQERRQVERRRLVVAPAALAVAVDAGVAVARSPAPQTRTAPSTRRSSRLLATPTAFRR